MLVFSTETSCDETSVCIMREDKTVLSHIVHTQTMHTKHGGVVPELASRAHLEILQHITKEALKESGVKLNNITYGGNPEPINKQIGYEIGAWFIAYLVNDHGEDKILDIYSLYEEFGFEKSFEMQFGRDYRTYLEEFYEFLDLPEDQIMAILLSK